MLPMQSIKVKIVEIGNPESIQRQFLLKTNKKALDIVKY